MRGLIESALRFAYAGGWPGHAWSALPGATRVDLLRHDLALLPSAGAGARTRAPLRVAFLSDIHIGPTTPRGTIDNAFRLVSEARPDVLVLGGDYVFLEATPARARELEARVAAVPARVKLAVLGNHDLWTRHAVIEDALRRAGATVLVNDAVRLPPPHEDVAILGLDDPWTGTPDPDRAFAACGDAAVKLAVCHAPEGWPHVRGRGAALLLCGHTHGGQLALPGGPIIVHGRYGRRWPSGLHDIEGLPLFVSRGVGVVEIPMRTFAPPDVAVFTLTAATA